MTVSGFTITRASRHVRSERRMRIQKIRSPLPTFGRFTLRSRNAELLTQGDVLRREARSTDEQSPGERQEQCDPAHRDILTGDPPWSRLPFGFALRARTEPRTRFSVGTGRYCAQPVSGSTRKPRFSPSTV